MPSYSLWLEPPNGPLNTKLEARIKALSAQQGGPFFKPHVTLVPAFPAPSDDAAVSSATAAVKDLKAYHIDLERVSCGGVFFQCVYVLCKPTQEVMDANRVATERLEFNTGPYMPHLSLLYGGVDEDTRRNVAESEQQLLFGRGNEDLGWDVSTVSVWSTEPGDLSLKSWRQLAVIPLSS